MLRVASAQYAERRIIEEMAPRGERREEMSEEIIPEEAGKAVDGFLKGLQESAGRAS